MNTTIQPINFPSLSNLSASANLANFHEMDRKKKYFSGSALILSSKVPFVPVRFIRTQTSVGMGSLLIGHIAKIDSIL